MTKENYNEHSLKKEEELKKYFYSIGLYLKLKYAENIHSSVTIQELYKRAKQKNIEVMQWNAFIRNELNIKFS